MNRIEFTQKIVKLLSEMIADGETPIIDYVMRSPEEQFNLYKKGREVVQGEWVIVGQIVTKCDGYKIKSAHNSGTAADIYFIVGGKMDFSKDRYIKWHDRWVELGGRQAISWDLPHFG